jgi:hypothetical protein
VRSNSLTDPATIRSNHAGEITSEQVGDLKDKLGGVSSWFTLVIMAALFVLTVALVGDVLARSTPLALAATVGVILISVAITSSIGGLIGERRIAHITVEPSPGEVIWKDNRYVAQAMGRTLEPITSNLGLQPGDYTFYVAHGTKWLLAAESVEMAHDLDSPPSLDGLKALLDKPIDFDPRQSPDKAVQRIADIERAARMLQTQDPSRIAGLDAETARQLARRVAQQMGQLMAGQHSIQGILQVAQAAEQAARPPLDSQGMEELRRALEQVGAADPQALEANRQGRQTGKQRRAPLADLRSNLQGAIIVLIGGVGLVYLGYSQKDFTASVAAGGFMLLIELVLLSLVRTELADWASGQALVEQGIVSKYTRTTHGRRSYTHYYFRVNQVRLEVSHLAYDALLEGRPYRLYYAPGSKRLLNVEPVQDSQSS